jgi:hypothetical protein
MRGRGILRRPCDEQQKIRLLLLARPRHHFMGIVDFVYGASAAPAVCAGCSLPR